MSNYNTPKKLHNPKSHSPGVYIPCWLLQVSSELISHPAKILYGRLAQWSNSLGVVYRSQKQLSAEIGVHFRTIERHLKELRDVGLINTYQAEAGGVNYFEFYDHPWMYEELKPELSYSNEPPQTPSAPIRQPLRKDAATPSAEQRYKNIIEIKKDNNYIPDSKKSGKAKSFSNYQDDERFMRFYNEYPKKVDPRDAHKAFKAIVGNDDELLEQIISDLKIRKQKHSQWSDKQYIKYPAVYLRKGEYLGEIINEADNKAEHRAKLQQEAQERVKAQEIAFRKKHEIEKINQQNKKDDGKVYKRVLSQAASSALHALRGKTSLNFQQ